MPRRLTRVTLSEIFDIAIRDRECYFRRILAMKRRWCYDVCNTGQIKFPAIFTRLCIEKIYAL